MVPIRAWHTAFLGLPALALLAARASAAATTPVQFVVATPTVDPQPAEIYCSFSLDGWPESGRPLARVAPGLYAATWNLTAGAKLEYKFLRTKSWTTVEKGVAGQELANRRLTVQADGTRQVVFHAVARWADQPNTAAYSAELAPPPGTPQPTAQKSTLTGDIRVHENIESPQLGNKRTIRVYLPPGYVDEPDRGYPVLYMHDGQNVFDAKTAFLGIEWGVDETAERLIRAGKLPKLIIVAVDNTPQRMAEYTPFTDKSRGGGRGDAYLNFLIDTVKPFIDRTYRTQPDRHHTAIAGSSLGGLVSLYAVFKRPDVFSAAGVESPALWWADGEILNFVRKHKPAQRVRLWIDIGTAEGTASGPLTSFSHAVEDCRKLVELLRAAGFKEGSDFHYAEIEGGRHNEGAWAQRVEPMLLYLFP